MPHPSFRLPPELLVLICEYLTCEGIRNWGLACKHLHKGLEDILHEQDSTRGQHRAAPWACRYGFLDLLKRSLKNGTDVNREYFEVIRSTQPGTIRFREDLHPPELFPTLLHIATYYNQIDTIKYLISRGADMTPKGPWLVDHHPEALKLLLPSVGLEMNVPFIIDCMITEWAPSSIIETVLSHIDDLNRLATRMLLETACAYHRIDIFDMVIHWYSADMINAALSSNVLPMHGSIIILIGRVCSLPKRKPLSLASQNNHGYTSLLLLSMEPWVPIDATRYLLELGADPHQRRRWPSSDLYFQEFPTEHWPHQVPAILGTRWQMSGTALGYALALTLMDRTSHYQRDNREKARLLLEYVSFMLTTTTWPFSANEIMDHIQSLGGGFMLCQTNRYGETHLSSLLSWVVHGQEGGPNGSQRPTDRWADDIACLVHSLLETDQSETYLTTAATDGPSKGLLPIEIICRHPVPSVSNRGWDFQCFCQVGMISIMDTLLVHGANVDTKDADGKSLLHWAAKLGSIERVYLLVTYGANIWDVDNNGFTALHFACQTNVDDIDPKQLSQRVDMVRLLISSGANLNAKTNEGFTPLFLACQTLASDVVSFLRYLEAPVLKDNYGRSPRDAIEHAEAQYINYHLGELGAMSSLLFELGDTDYVYDPRETVLSILNDPTCHEEYKSFQDSSQVTEDQRDE
ncbi:ankyrin [Hypoxylon sp. FL0890]|nr:ankyrin [Hypoxylon sp. FL0890]